MSGDADLRQFLAARIAEDEAVAREAVAGPWTEHDCGSDCCIWISEPNDPEGQMAGVVNIATSRHIARWDPKRVLAECSVKRSIVLSAGSVSCSSVHPGMDVYHPGGHDSPVLKALAAVYADHPDYRQEWA